MRYGLHDILVLPQDLQDFAWSAPMRELAKKVGLSDVGLKKLLKAQGISTPPQGYWNRVHAGKPVPKRPEMPERGPGERGRLCVDARFADVIPAAEPLSSSGPFVSARVPEDLEKLYRRELKAIGRLAVPRTSSHCAAGSGKRRSARSSIAAGKSNGGGSRSRHEAASV